MTKLHRILSAVLCVMMLLTLLPAGAFAADDAPAAQPAPAALATPADPDAHNIFTTHQGNPYLPLWEYIPDGEPYVFEDPDNPGKYRAYIYGSHDMLKTAYCGTDLVTWSAPVEDLTQWRYDGVIFESADASGSKDILYAPDMAVVTDPDTGKKTYYLYPNNQAGSRNSMVAKSDRPDGPFEVVNWSNDNHTSTTGPLGFDPAVFVDDDGRVYGYWGFQRSYAAELDPTTMATVKPGTQTITDMIPNEAMNNNGSDPVGFRFYEASSIRKIDGMYVFVYSRVAKDSEPTGKNYNQLAYAYSENPLGPWTFGGIIVDAQGEVLNASTHERSFPGGNTHGSICQINGQWYVFYHRNLETYARQAMVEPIDVKVDAANKTVSISRAEVTSNGFSLDGLDPYRRQAAAIACYMTPAWSTKMQPVYDKTADALPIVSIRNETVLGYKYFNFDANPAEGQSTQLELELKPLGRDADIDVYLRPTTAVDTPVQRTDGVISSVGEGSYKVGSFHLSADMPQEYTTVRAAVPQVDEVNGKWGVFLVFRGAANTDLCELYSLQFLNGEAELRDSFDGGLSAWQAKDAHAADGSLTLDAGGSIVANDGERWSDYALNADVAEQSGALHFRLLQTDEENYYELTVQDGRLQLTSTVYGVTKTVGSAEIGVQAPYRLIVDAADGVLSVRVNGALRLAARNTDHAAGTVGVIADGGAKLDEISVERSTFTPPADRLRQAPRTDKITVDGQPLENFRQDVSSYQVAVSGEKTPVVAASSSDPTTAVSVVQADSVPGNAFVHFISATGEISRYTISFGRQDAAQSFAGLSALPNTWEYVNTTDNAQNSVSFDSKGVVLNTATSSNADYPPDGRKNNPAIGMVQNLKGNWVVDAKVSADTELKTQDGYPAYGLGLYASNRSYLKYVLQGRFGAQNVQFAGRVAGGDTGEINAECGGTTNWLRLSKNGNVITAYRSPDGASYQQIGQVTVNDDFESVQLQFYATKLWSSGDFNACLESVQVMQQGASAQPPAEQDDVDKAAVAIGPILHIDGAAAMSAEEKMEIARAQMDVNETVQSLGVSYALAQSGDGFSLTVTKGSATLTLPQIELSDRVIDLAVLLFRLEDAEACKEEDYTFATWSKLQSAIEQAAACTVDSSPLEIADAYERLMQALDHLVEKPDEPGHECSSDQFTDVVKDPKFWYHDGIDYMVRSGYMNGTDATTFKPLANIKRGDLVVILYRYENEPDVSALSNPFTDITKDYYRNAITWAADKKIVNGKSDTKFGPEDPITREQLAAMLYRWAGAKAPAEDKLADFPDGGKVQSYAKDAMNWAVDQGIITGVKDEKTNTTTLNPQGNANRAQIAVMLERYLNK